jgi:RNA polymerase sigma-70 factor (ECF subfamily)
MTDRELILKIGSKDHQALKELVDQYQEIVLNTCYNLVGNRQDAEDVTQEVFFQIYKSISQFRQESKLSTWIYRIAVNRSLNFIRDQKRFRWIKSISSLLEEENRTVSEVPAPDSMRPDVTLARKEQELMIRKAIDSLPGKQKAAFVLYAYETISYQEIAEIMSCSHSSVESLIHRAKLNLQNTLIHNLEEK